MLNADFWSKLLIWAIAHQFQCRPASLKISSNNLQSRRWVFKSRGLYLMITLSGGVYFCFLNPQSLDGGGPRPPL